MKEKGRGGKKRDSGVGAGVWLASILCPTIINPPLPLPFFAKCSRQTPCDAAAHSKRGKGEGVFQVLAFAVVQVALAVTVVEEPAPETFLGGK